MSGRYTESIEPLGLAAQGREFAGCLALAEMPRLQPLLKQQDGEVEFSLHFTVDEGGIPCVLGTVKADLVLECQRCMEAMEYQVDNRFRLGIAISRRDIEQLPDKYDPLLLGNDEISILSIIEDELILALPLVAMHKAEDCPRGAMLEGEENLVAGDSSQETKRENPFAILAQLKNQKSTEVTSKDEE